MNDLCIVKGFKSKCWPLQGYDKDTIRYLAKKNGLETSICNTSLIYKDDVYYIKIVYFENTIKTSFATTSCMYLITQKDYNSFNNYSLEYFGYTTSIEEYLSLCKSSAFGHISYQNEIHLTKLCNTSPEELFIYRDLRKNLT